MTFVIDLLYILLFHALGDFVFQSQWMVENKHDNNFIMIFHCVLWTGIIALGFEYILNVPLGTLSICFLFFGHYLMDKLNHPFVKKHKKGKTLDLDFLFHAVQLSIVYTYGGQ